MNDIQLAWFLMGGIVSIVIITVVFPSMFSVNQDLTYDFVRDFVNDCEKDNRELQGLRSEVGQLKNEDLYKENQELLIDKKRLEDLMFFTFICGVMLWMMAFIIMVYVVNRYQTNRITELENEMKKKKKSD